MPINYLASTDQTSKLICPVVLSRGVCSNRELQILYMVSVISDYRLSITISMFQIRYHNILTMSRYDRDGAFPFQCFLYSECGVMEEDCAHCYTGPGVCRPAASNRYLRILSVLTGFRDFSSSFIIFHLMQVSTHKGGLWWHLVLLP